jgi:hypothetical protein
MNQFFPPNTARDPSSLAHQQRKSFGPVKKEDREEFP